MEPIVQKLVSIVSRAERQLRELIAEAAGEGDYRGVDAARQAAVEIGEIRQRFTDGAIGQGSSSRSPRPNGKRIARRQGPGRRGIQGAYPRFTVDDDTLTKIGWSKKQKREYAHRVSGTIFDRTTQAMVTLANCKSGPFLAEDIIAKVNQSDDEQVPSYQVYIVIAFLRNTRCIRQQGRDGYDINPEVMGKAREAWEKCRCSS